MNTSASASTFSCPWRSPKPPSLLCGATFQSRGDLLLHGPRHSTERSYYCAPCSLHNKKPKLIHRNFSRQPVEKEPECTQWKHHTDSNLHREAMGFNKKKRKSPGDEKLHTMEILLHFITPSKQKIFQMQIDLIRKPELRVLMLRSVALK